MNGSLSLCLSFCPFEDKILLDCLTRLASSWVLLHCQALSTRTRHGFEKAFSAQTTLDYLQFFCPEAVRKKIHLLFTISAPLCGGRSLVQLYLPQQRRQRDLFFPLRLPSRTPYSPIYPLFMPASRSARSRPHRAAPFFITAVFIAEPFDSDQIPSVWKN